MPKLKTRKAFKKRFRVTKNGKVIGSASLRRHMMTDRSSKKKRQSRGPRVIEGVTKASVKGCLPYAYKD